jgi:hypothetical protein
VTVVTISDGAVAVGIEDVQQEQRPGTAVALDPVPDVLGHLVVYERSVSLRELSIRGRVLSKTEAELLESLIGSTVTLTERDGTATSGWHVRTDPPPNIRRKDGDSPDYLVDLKLWRLP